MTQELLDILTIGLYGLLGILFIKWCDAGLDLFFDHIKTIDERDHDRQNRRD